MKRRHLVSSALLALSSSAGLTQTSTAYRYDSLGRLASSATSNAPSGNKITAIAYDPAGNRSSYRVTDGSTAPTPTPTPSAAPTALNPTLNYSSSNTYSIAMSTLASSGSSAQITSFLVPSGGGSAAIQSGGQSVNYTAPNIGQPGMCEPAETYTYSVPYTVQNTSGGQSANGTATLNVKGPAGRRPSRGEQCP